MTVPEAVTILKKVEPDIKMPLRIQSEADLEKVLKSNMDIMTNDKILKFVEESEKLKSSNCK